MGPRPVEVAEIAAPAILLTDAARCHDYGAPLGMRPRDRHPAPCEDRCSDAVDRAVDRTREIRRSFYRLLQGPYTSVVLDSGDGTGVPYTVQCSERLALSIASVYRAVSIYADLIGTMPVSAYRGPGKLGVPGFLAYPAGAGGRRDRRGRTGPLVAAPRERVRDPDVEDRQGLPGRVHGARSHARHGRIP